ncbi:hypothetical protein [Roseobacter sp. A03A-229]
MSSAVNISDSQIKSWERQASDIEDKIRIHESQLSTLRKWIEAANLLRDAATASQANHTDTKVEHPESSDARYTAKSSNAASEDDGPSLVDAIVMVLRTAGKPKGHKQIKAMLGGTGFDVRRLKSSPNYYYTAVKRLVDRDIVAKYPDGTYELNKKTDLDDGSLFSTSSRSSFDTGSNQSGEPRAQGREAVPGGGP